MTPPVAPKTNLPHWHDYFSHYWTRRAAKDLRLFVPYELEYIAFKAGWLAAKQASTRQKRKGKLK